MAARRQAAPGTGAACAALSREAIANACCTARGSGDEQGNRKLQLHLLEVRSPVPPGSARGVAVVLLQEHHLLTTDAVVGAVASASNAGWHLLIEPALPSPGTATSSRYNTGGVAVAVQQHITARRLRTDDALKGRTIVVEAIGAGLPSARVMVASVYLEVGFADHETNRNILAAVAEAVAPAVGPYAIGGITICHRSSSETRGSRSC